MVVDIVALFARVRRLYLYALLLLLPLIALLAFLQISGRSSPVAIMRTMDAGHAFAFCLISWLLYLAVEPYGKRRALLISGSLSMLLVVLTEVLQSFVGRTASFEDIGISLLGVLVALSGVVVWHAMDSRVLRGGHVLLTILIALWVSQPAWDEWRAVWLRDQQFPVLGNFEDPLERRLWKASGVAHGHATQLSRAEVGMADGRYSLQIETVHDTWSGALYNADRQDWRGYSQLVIELYNPSTPFALNIRIDDTAKASPGYSERYNGLYQVAAGSNKLSIPLARIERGPRSRKLDLGSIRKMVLFTTKQEPSRVFYLDNVRLIP